MSTRKSTTKHKHLQPVANNQPIELANNPATWRKLNERIEKAVNDVCASGDFDAVDGLLLITDLLGNPEFDHVSREGVLNSIQSYAFRFTKYGENALQEYLDRLNPVRKRRVRA